MERAARINAAGECGFRLLPVPGEVFTEIEAIRLLTGAEGAVWLALRGSTEQLAKAEELMREVSGEISQSDVIA